MARQYKLGLLFCLMSGIASAGGGVIDLNFAGVSSEAYPFSDNPFVQGFYDGGTSSDGTTGVNYGINFPGDAQVICLNTVGVVCSNTSQGGLGNPASAYTAMFFLNASSTYLDDPAGFTNGFSFDYTAVYNTGSVEVYSGLDGTGSELGSITLGLTPSTCDGSYNAGFCPFVAEGVSFAGTAESIEFDGVENEIVYDDITFGSATVGGVPEPGTLGLAFAGLAGVGLFQLRGRKRRANA